MSPVETLANQMADSFVLIYRSLLKAMPENVQLTVERVLVDRRAEIVQCYADHFRLALTDEQAAECAEYAARPKPAAWDRYESATRIAGEKVGSDFNAALEKALS